VLSCDQILLELSRYLDDESAATLRRDIEAHMSGCRTCRVLYDSTKKTLTILTDSRSFELPESLSERMVESVMKRLQGDPSD
jgi:predicted anti-sigma-YlaC factor YlaD